MRWTISDKTHRWHSKWEFLVEWVIGLVLFLVNDCTQIKMIIATSLFQEFLSCQLTVHMLSTTTKSSQQMWLKSFREKRNEMKKTGFWAILVSGKERFDLFSNFHSRRRKSHLDLANHFELLNGSWLVNIVLLLLQGSLTEGEGSVQ